jgi:integrase
MSIKQYKTDDKTFYEVHIKIRIKGKQVNRRRRKLTSIAAAKREETKLLLELLRLEDLPQQVSWNSWSLQCLEKIRIEFRNSTLVGYQSHFKKWVNPVLGEKRLQDITSADIHNLIFNQTPGIGNESRKGILKHIKRVFSMAIDEGVLTRNPAKGIKVKVSESKKLVLNKTEIDILLLEAKLKNHPYYDHWVMALLTGMRSGELYALQWSDIDLDSGFISITKSWGRKNGFGPTKSSLNRVTPISRELKSFLISIRSENSSSTDPVLERFASWSEGRQAEILREFCTEVGISNIRFHDLRATFITQLLLQGVPVAKVMTIVGHSQLKTTMVYVRLVGNDVKGVTDELKITLPKPQSNENVISLFGQ